MHLQGTASQKQVPQRSESHRRKKIVITITSAKKLSRGWHIKVKPSSGNGLHKENLIDCFQIKSVSQLCFTKRIGVLSTKDMDSVKVCIAGILDLL
jgi:mRNA-degrading endonuclease toxin of MazEF toxin-antitoxin module